MFNKNSRNTTVNNSNNNSPTINMISEGTKVNGNVHSNSDIRVAGSIEGEALSKGKLIVTASGRIKGDVTSSDADVAGRLEGEVRISNKLILRKSAIVDGNIYTKSLLVEEGAQINGACRMGIDTPIQPISKSNNGVEKTPVKSA